MFKYIIFIVFSVNTEAQIFIPHTYWRCNSTDYDSVTTATSSDFSQGTFSNTNTSGNSVVLSVGNSTGTYTSKVYDIFGGCSPLATWRNFDWISTLPFGKEIPTTSEIATDYSAINTGLTTNLVELFHLNGSGTVTSGTAITASVGSSGTATDGSALVYTASGKLNSALTFNGTASHVTVPYTQTAVSDYSIATWFRTSSAANNVFVQDRGSGAGNSLTLGIGANPGGCAIGKISYGLDSNGVYIGKCSSNTYNDGNWQHVVGTWDGTSGTAVAPSQFTIYVNGVSVSTTSITVGSTNAPLTGLGNTKLGRHDAWGVNLNGSLDEVAIWTRALSATDAEQVFRRGGNRVKFQIRTCTISDCSDIATYKGPDNTNATFFTEINNNSIQNTGLGTVLTTKPSMIFSNFSALTVTRNRFFQYQTTFETDNTTFMPNITSTSIYHGCASGSQTFTTNSTFTLPRLCTQMTVTANGAGGGSGRRTGGGTKAVGGRGGQATKTFTGLTPLSSYTITIGSGGLCASTASTGAYAGGAGGAGNTIGSAGSGALFGGAGGTGGSATGGLGQLGGGGGGGGGGPNDAASGGAATSLVFSGADWVVAGGGGGSGGSQSGTAGVGGASCSGVASGDYTLGGAGGNGSSNSGSGGGGGGCYCLGGCSSASAAGGVGGNATGTGCGAGNDGAAGSVTIDYQ